VGVGVGFSGSSYSPLFTVSSGMLPLGSTEAVRLSNRPDFHAMAAPHPSMTTITRAIIVVFFIGPILSKGKGFISFRVIIALIWHFLNQGDEF
jgi:hypothetical protein